MSAKNMDKHNRWRNKTVAFRVSPEEDAQIEMAVKLTGLTKQDYIMAVNRLTKHLNVNASRLLEEHQVKYENKTRHAGRRIRLTYMVVEAPAFEVIEVIE